MKKNHYPPRCQKKNYWKENVTGIGGSRGHARCIPPPPPPWEPILLFCFVSPKSVCIRCPHPLMSACPLPTGNTGSITDWYDERDLNDKLIFIDGAKCKWANRETNMVPACLIHSSAALPEKSQNKKNIS